MRWLLPYFRPATRELLVVEALLLAGAGASLGASWAMGAAIDHASAPGAPLWWVVVGALSYALLVGLAAVATWVARIRIEAVAQQAMLAVKKRLFSHLLRHDVALHDRYGSGALLARVSGDVEAMRLLFSEVILQLPGDIALVAGMFVVLGLSAPLLMGIVAMSVPLWVGLVVVYRRVSPAAFGEVRSHATALGGWMAETIPAIPLLRSLDRTGFAADHTAALGQARFDADLRYGLQSVWFFNGLFGVRSGVLALVVWVGAEQVAEGALSAGVLLVAVDYARKMVEPFLRLQFHITTLERARVGGSRVKELLDTPRSVRDPESPAEWPGVGEGIRLDDVSFSYAPEVPLFTGVSLWVPAGRRIAIVGPTGGGKSSLIQLVARFRDPVGGAVRIAGADLKSLRVADLRLHIGLVTQAVQLLPGTVLENLGLEGLGLEGVGLEGGDGRARALALLAEVGLTERLTPETRVGPGGETLSRGEVQLLCLARTLVHEPAVLLLDEATSAMDPDTEARVMRVLADRPDRTLLTVAHRLRTVVGYDQIVVFDRGIVESGTHEELLQAGGAYAALWRAQVARERSPDAEVVL